MKRIKGQIELYSTRSVVIIIKRKRKNVYDSKKITKLKKMVFMTFEA